MTRPMPGGGRGRPVRRTSPCRPVLADDFADAVCPTVAWTSPRARRHEAEQEEADLSYLRRMLHGRIDIVRAELRRRHGDQGEGSLIDQLAGILADGATGAPHGMGRHVTVEPSRVDDHRRAVEQLASDAGISDVVHRSDVELADSLARLEDYERAVSGNRRKVQEVMDGCTAEIARRYQSGEATVDDLLNSR